MGGEGEELIVLVNRHSWRKDATRAVASPHLRSSSVQLKVVSMRSKKPICTPPIIIRITFVSVCACWGKKGRELGVLKAK